MPVPHVAQAFVPVSFVDSQILRYLSIFSAAFRPSAIAQTTSD
jgi:hypothetical protein